MDILSARDRQVLDIAQYEVSVEGAEAFEPITRGPILAVLGLGLLGVVAFFYLLFTKILKVLRLGS